METDKWGRRIRAFRKLKGYTQEGLAKNIGFLFQFSVKLKEAAVCPKSVLMNIELAWHLNRGTKTRGRRKRKLIEGRTSIKIR